MRGKLGIVVGLGIGYVLGTRAGRERYEQIREQAQRVWELEPVQRQVDRVKQVALSSALAIPRTLWKGAVKVVQASAGGGTPGQRLDGAIDAGKETAEELAEAVSETPAKPAAKKPAARKPAARKTASSSTTKRSTTSRSTTSRKKTGES